jgi:hypothetical protein
MPASQHPARISAAPIVCLSVETRDVLASGFDAGLPQQPVHLGFRLPSPLLFERGKGGANHVPVRALDGRNVARLNPGLARRGIRVHGWCSWVFLHGPTCDGDRGRSRWFHRAPSERAATFAARSGSWVAHLRSAWFLTAGDETC